MVDKQKVCIAMGDGGMDDRNPLMDLYILAQTSVKTPKVCFLATASGDNQGLINHFHHLFKRYPCETFDLALFHPHTADIDDFIHSMDIVYVGGGQSKSMMACWKGWCLDDILCDAYNHGTILSGGSAGAVCWFRECITDSIPGRLTVMPCLDILPDSFCPHFASQERRASYGNFIKSGEITAGYACDDYAAVHFIDGKFHRAISNRPYAKAYHLSMDNDVFQQRRLYTKWLGMKDTQEELIWNSTPFAELR
jgi:dipeptidase E